MRNFKVTVNGQSYNVTVEEVSAFSAAVPMPLQSYAPAAAPVAAAMSAPAPTPAAAPAPVAAAPAPAPARGGVEIKAPMPGMLLDYKVAEGAEVKKGQAVLVLEAMKMENDISAPADGKVSFVKAKGTNVSTGDVMAVIV